MTKFASLFFLMAPFLVDGFLFLPHHDEHREGGSRTTTIPTTPKGSYPHVRTLSGGKGGKGGGKGKKDSCYEYYLQVDTDELTEKAYFDSKNATSTIFLPGDTYYLFASIYEPGTSNKIGTYVDISTAVPGEEFISTATFSVDFDEENQSYDSQISVRRTLDGTTNALYAGIGRFENTYGRENGGDSEVVDGAQRQTLVLLICNDD